jgi:hypothetical protein
LSKFKVKLIHKISAGIHHAESGNTDYQLQLEIWKGNIGKALELAVEKKQLSDWLVAISHLGKHVDAMLYTRKNAQALTCLLHANLLQDCSRHRITIMVAGLLKIFDTKFIRLVIIL